MHARFYAPDARASGDVVALPQDEAEHATRVLRLSTDDAVVVFNGRGQAFDAVVESVGKSSVSVRLGALCVAASEARVSLTLAQAVLKGDKMDDVVRDAVMIGVSGIQPIITSRTEVARGVVERSHRRDRWQRIAVSSAKQCGRAVVPQVLDVDSLEALLSSGAADTVGARIMFVEPGASKLAGPLQMSSAAAPPHAATVLIGPEGGWTPEEITAAEGTCQLVTLGGRTLRADAMALVAVTALFTAWGEYAG